ncbi:MAG: ParA family protein [Ilumatobacteraceae bacterium]
MGNIVTVLNQKGGVGKTTVTLGLASAAGTAGHGVLVVDLDPQASSTWVLGIDPTAVEVSTAEVLGRTSASKAIVESTWGEAVAVMPATQRLLTKDHASNPGRLAEALAEVAKDYELILIDCPPSLGALTTAGLTAANHALIVVEPSALSLRGIGAVADLVDEVWDSYNTKLDIAGVIVNKVPAWSSEAERRYDELTRTVGKKAVWTPVIPQRVIVNQAIGERRPIHSYGARSTDVSEAFDELWKKLRRVMGHQ